MLSLENLLTPLVLVALKIIVAPILSIFFSNLLGVPGDLALYTFIYGTLPTAYEAAPACRVGYIDDSEFTTSPCVPCVTTHVCLPSAPLCLSGPSFTVSEAK